MPRGNIDNLIPNTERTAEEIRRNCSKAGKASGESRRRKKELKECLEILLEKEVVNNDGNTISGAEAMAAKAFQLALKGDMRAWEIVRDTAGQKPVEKVMVSDVDASVIEEVERMVDSNE